MTVLLAAVVLDWIIGDPRSRWHPVAWTGTLLAAGRARAPRASPAGLVLHGAVVVAVVAGLVGAAVVAARQALLLLPPLLALVGQAWLLKCAFSVRGLFSAVELVRAHLVTGDLDGARRELGRHLVSRRTDDLGTGAVASGAIESLAENFTDSWVAPVFWFVVACAIAGLGAGLAAAWLYRVVNTADAMIGYRDGDLRYLGRVAARADDALNLIPARLAACILVAGAGLAGRSPRAAWQTWRRDGPSTASPNAGLTMAAMAGALGVALEKRGHYRLGSGAPPDALAIDGAISVSRWAVAVSLGVALLALRTGGCA